MNNHKNTVFVLGMLITILLTTAGFPQMASAGRSRSHTRTVSTPDELSKSFNVKKGENLSVNVTGDVSITTWDKDEVVVKIEGLDEDEVKEVVVTQSGSTVSVAYPSRNNSNSDVAFNITMPKQFNVSIKTSGGEISCRGPVIGDVTGKTAGGDITIGDITGKLEMKTAGGEITVGNVTGDIDVGTSGGDISVGRIDGEVKIRTSGGEISVKDATKSVTVSTNGGDISIGDVKGDLKAATSGGNISVANVGGVCKLSTSGGDVQVKSAKKSLHAATSGGDVKLTGVAGSVNAVTSGGTVYVEMLSEGDDDSKLVSSGGKVTLLISEKAKVSIDAVINTGDWNRSKDRYKIISDFKSETEVEDNSEIRGSFELNGGGKRIKIRTVNSDIVIKKLSK